MIHNDNLPYRPKSAVDSAADYLKLLGFEDNEIDQDSIDRMRKWLDNPIEVGVGELFRIRPKNKQ